MGHSVFISYRRAQGLQEARKIASYLGRLLPPSRIFFDQDSIEGGSEFPEMIRQALHKSSLLLLLVGEDWASLQDTSGRKRLDSKNDFVRIEVEYALANGVKVIPILLPGAKMPVAEDLPPPLKALANKQAYCIAEKNITLVLDRLILEIGVGVMPSATVLQSVQKYAIITEWHPNLRGKLQELLRYCDFKPYESVVGMVDLTIAGDGRHFIAFTNAGIYHRSIGTTDQLAVFFSYGKIESISHDARNSVLVINHSGLNIAGTMEEEAHELLQNLLRVNTA